MTKDRIAELREKLKGYNANKSWEQKELTKKVLANGEMMRDTRIRSGAPRVGREYKLTEEYSTEDRQTNRKQYEEEIMSAIVSSLPKVVFYVGEKARDKMTSFWRYKSGAKDPDTGRKEIESFWPSGVAVTFSDELGARRGEGGDTDNQMTRALRGLQEMEEHLATPYEPRSTAQLEALVEAAKPYFRPEGLTREQYFHVMELANGYVPERKEVTEWRNRMTSPYMSSPRQ